MSELDWLGAYPNFTKQWEIPDCNFCGSHAAQHKQIFYNVQNTYHHLVECQVCKLRFYSPRINLASILEQGYGTYEPARLEAENHIKERELCYIEDYYNGILDRVLSYKKVDSAYEVGGAIGKFSSLLKAKDATILDGCDINKWSVKVAQEKYGLTTWTHTNFYDLKDFKIDYYDLGIMLDYIEHSFYPFDDLKKLGLMVKSGGLLLLKTFLEEWDVNRSMEAVPGHNYHFYGDVLKNMIIKSGFSILHEKKEAEQIQIIAQRV